jgi:lysozyme
VEYRLLTLVCTLCVVLFACVAEPEPVEDVGSTAEALRVCGESPGIAGIDVSHWQGTIDWDRVAGDGVKFAIIRVSDGTGTMDSQFHRNWDEARRVGVLRGVYQFFRPSQDPIAQADLLLREMGALEADDLPPVIDVEADGGRTPAQIRDAIRAWIDRVEGATGRKVLIYTARYFWESKVGNTDAFADNPLWVANWGVSCPDLPGAWADWAFWQTSDSGRVAGISGNVDLDVFDGTLEELRTFGGPRCTAHCEGDTIVGDDCGTGDCAAYGSRCVDDSRGVRCAFAFCPDTGTADVCIDDATIGHCSDGAVEPGDCSAFAALCSTAGRTENEARCVSAFCVSGPDEVPVAHEGCWPEGGKLLHCDADGEASAEPCPEGEACSMVGGVGHCAPIVCPATGEADVCVDESTLGHCTGGSVVRAESCVEGCVAGEIASCAGMPSAPPDSPMGGELDAEPRLVGTTSCTAAPGRSDGTSGAGLLLVALSVAARRRRTRP